MTPKPTFERPANSFAVSCPRDCARRENMLRGGCLCGGIRYDIVGPVGVALYCRCSMCRKFHGTASRARLSLPKSSFRFVQGEDLLTSYRSSEDTIKRFCRIRGSPMVNSSERVRRPRLPRVRANADDWNNVKRGSNHAE